MAFSLCTTHVNPVFLHLSAVNIHLLYIVENQVTNLIQGFKILFVYGVGADKMILLSIIPSGTCKKWGMFLPLFNYQPFWLEKTLPVDMSPNLPLWHGGGLTA